MRLEQCTKAQRQLEHVRALKSEFDAEFAHAFDVGNTRKAHELRVKLEVNVKELSAEFFMTRMIETTCEGFDQKINTRFSDFASDLHFNVQRPELSKGWTSKHVEILNGIFGSNNLEPRILPSVDDLHGLDKEYFRVMFPEPDPAILKESREDRTNPYDKAKGLVSYRPSWWWNVSQPDNEYFARHGYATPGENVMQNMKRELEKIGGTMILMETIKKPKSLTSLFHKYYGHQEDATEKDDALIPLFRGVFGKESNRFDHSWQEIQENFIPRLEEEIKKRFEEAGLEVPMFQIIMIPALLNNMDMTCYHPEQSQRYVNEFTSSLLPYSSDDSVCITLGDVGASDTGLKSLESQIFVPLTGVRFAVILGKIERLR